MSVLYEKLVKKIKNFDAKKYSYSRNYIDGEVSRLSPYISRGFISTSQVFEILKINFSSIKEIEKFVQELAWRDYFQLIWNEKNVEVRLKRKYICKRNRNTKSNFKCTNIYQSNR
jgi:deoxyribodipyrimidine photo-lyase